MAEEVVDAEYYPMSLLPRSPQPGSSCMCQSVANYLVEEVNTSSPSSNSSGNPLVRGRSLEANLRELFRLHDLNSNGTLEEHELVQLNVKVALLHHGRDADLDAVRVKFRQLFRENFDPDGKAVHYPVFRNYLFEVLDAMDKDPRAQEMMAEQFICEAKAARAVFHLPSFASRSDLEYIPTISCQDICAGEDTGEETTPRTRSDPYCEDDFLVFSEEDAAASDGTNWDSDRQTEHRMNRVYSAEEAGLPPKPARPSFFIEGGEGL